jgi:hypothetical protein
LAPARPPAGSCIGGERRAPGHDSFRATLLAILTLTASLASAQPCDVRPDLPADTARRILAICEAEREPAPRPHESELFRALGWAHYPAKLADFASTEIALRRPGAYEANPLMESRGVRIATTIALPVAMNVVTAKLYRKHPKWATALRIVAVAVPSALAVSNLSQR